MTLADADAAARPADPARGARRAGARSRARRVVMRAPAPRRDPRADRHRQERARASRSPSGSTARSSTAIRPPSIAASTSAPTRCRSPSGAASRTTSIDVADPTEEYTAARYAREAAAAIRDITARGRLPILVGGTGFYYRALTRGLFPGPGRDAALRARLERDRRSRAASSVCTACCARVDPASARAHSAARSEAAGPRARGLLPDRPAADRALRRHARRRLPDYDVVADRAADSRRS